MKPSPTLIRHSRRFNLGLFAFTCLFALTILSSAFCQEKAEFNNPARKGRISSQQLMAHIEYLASDELKGRVGGTPELEIAADYIAGQFAEIGLEPGGTAGYFQPFEYGRGRRRADEQAQTAAPKIRNVVGKLIGSGPNKDEWIVIGGHYDHVRGRGAGTDTIANGADDNASGTAGTIEIARMLKEGAPLNRSVVFIAFTAEEMGLVGSNYYANNPTVPADKMVAMLNMDMIGRLHNNKLQLNNMNSGAEFAEAAKRLNKHYYFNLLPGTTGASDHSSFVRKQIPVIFMFTGIHPQLHQVGDHVNLINVGGAVNIAQFTADFAYEISSWKDGPTYVDAPNAGPLHSQENEGQLTLRSDGLLIPTGVGLDVTVEVSLSSNSSRGRQTRGGSSGGAPGIKVTAVTTDSPAAQAGMKVGDRLTRIGEFPIGTAKALADALASFNPGDKATIAVVRGGEQINLAITFGR